MSSRMRRRLPIVLATCFCAALLSAPLASGGRLSAAGAVLAGVLALAWFLARLVDTRTAAYGAVALSTMPLFFVTARASPGDVVAMGASSIAVAGLAVAAFDRRCGEGRAVRLVSFSLGVGGLVAGGLAGGAPAVAAPALGVGLAWMLLEARPGSTMGLNPAEPGSAPYPGAPIVRAAAHACGALALLSGTVAFALAVRVQLSRGPDHPQFDVVAHRLGHALFPWSGLLPLAFIALLSPPARRGPLAFAREEAARAVVLAAAVAAFAVHSLDGRGAVPFLAPAIPAAALALAARDLDRRRTAPSAGLRDATVARAVGIVAALLTALLARDLIDAPDRALAAVVTLRAGTPIVSSGTWVRGAAVVFSSVLVLTAFDPPRPPVRWSAPYLGWLHTIVQTWDGRLATGLCAVEATLGGLAMFAVRHPTLGVIPRGFALHAFWAFPVAIVAAVWVPLAARDGLHALRRRAHLPRGSAVIGAGTLAGALLAWGHYPALLGQLATRAAPAASTPHQVDRGSSRDR